MTTNTPPTAAMSRARINTCIIHAGGAHCNRGIIIFTEAFMSSERADELWRRAAENYVTFTRALQLTDSCMCVYGVQISSAASRPRKTE